MNPTTAVGLILVGIALVWSLENRTRGKARWIAHGCSGVVVLLGLVKLVGVAFDWHPNVDEFLFRSMINSAGGAPNRMAPNTALDLVLLGGALLLLDLRWRGTSGAQLLAAVAGFAALLPLTGYLYGVSSFEGIASFIPMAPHTAIVFLFLAAGVFFARPKLDWSQNFATRDPRGVLARRLGPAVVVLILVLGWIRLKAEHLGFFPTNFGTALFAVTLSSLFLLLMGWATVAIGRADRERHTANLSLLESKVALEESLREIQLIIDHAREIICTVDQNGKLLTISSGVEPILGWRAKELVGSSFLALHLAEDRPEIESALRRVKTGLLTGNIAARCLRKDQTLASIAWSLQSSPHHRRTFCVGREQ
ncbi:MAG: PAS domain-containing protein [Verrucomicrobiota bacterium]|nr:PAS domain-containing protein [Verrucomicrobiota bacterium]